MEHKIIGITGTIGAGKGAAVSYLVTQKGFTHFSARALLAEKMDAENIAINRDSMVAYANELRKAHGPQYLFDELYERARRGSTPAVIESIRTVGEAEALKVHGGFLLAVDAAQGKRYERAHGRGSVLDQVSFDEFQKQEAREMHSTDPHEQNISAVMAMADVTILNNGTLSNLYREIEHALSDV